MGTTLYGGPPGSAVHSTYERRRNQYLANAFLSLATEAAPALVDPRRKVLVVTEVDLYADGAAALISY